MLVSKAAGKATARTRLQNLMVNLKNRRTGFSLVELLVVIVIITGLAGVAFNVNAKARKFADESVTTANLRQIGVTLISHTADNGRFPIQQGDAVWGRCLLPFLGYSNTLTGNCNISSKTSPDLGKSAQIFAFPTDKKPRANDTYNRSFAIARQTSLWNYQQVFFADGHIEKLSARLKKAEFAA